jgi:hypothetical protein
MRNKVLCVLAMCLFGSAYGAETVSCSPAVVKADNKTIILPGVSQPKETMIYLFNNISKESLWLDHPVPHPSASAGWSSYVRPGHWSAMLINRKDFAINCAEIKPGQVEYKDCAKAITICSPKNAAFTSKRKGTYWLVEDKPWDDLIQGLQKRGVEFKAKK